MPERALYFPQIQLPQSQWLVRCLLYWDAVAAIVPYEYFRRRDILGPYMSDLVDCGLVETISPGQYLPPSSTFANPFLALVDADSRSQRGGWIQIHMEKLGSLPDELIERGLARRSQHPWFDVEEGTANAFMAYLAGVLGRSVDAGLVPITDSGEALSRFLPPSSVVSLDDRLRDARGGIVERTLPAPAVEIPPKELRQFKDRYQEQLTRYRRRVEAVAVSVAAVLDADERQQVLNRQAEELQAETDDLRSQMRAAGWAGVNTGTVCALVASAVPAYQTVVSFDPLSVVATSFGLIAAVYEATAGWRERAELRSRPLAYAALAHEWFPANPVGGATDGPANRRLQPTAPRES